MGGKYLYNALVRKFYEGSLTRGGLLSDFQSAFERGELSQEYLSMLPHILRAMDDIANQREYYSREDRFELRTALRSSRGLLAGTIERILGLSNVFNGRGLEVKGSDKRRGKEILSPEAVKIASYFGIPWARLLDSASIEPWFHACGQFPDTASRQRGEYSQQFSPWYQFGYEEVFGQRVGLTLCRTRNFTEITLATTAAPSQRWVDWEEFLRYKVLRLRGLLGDCPHPNLYTREMSLFSPGMHIDRVLGFNPSDDESRVWLYLRVFNRTVWRVGSDTSHVLEPFNKRAQTLSLIAEVNPLPEQRRIKR